MDRKEFCELLSKARKESGITTKKMYFTMDLSPTTIYRIEKGFTNINLELALKHLSSIKYCMILEYSNKKHTIQHYDDIVEVIRTLRKHKKYSQRKLATLSGITYVQLANIEAKKNIVRIDTFLKIVAILDCLVQIKKQTDKTPT